MNESATDMAQNKRDHRDENHLYGGRHCPMMPQARSQSERTDIQPDWLLELFEFAEIRDRWKLGAGVQSSVLLTNDRSSAEPTVANLATQ
jgi:hypothetical protein